MRSLESFIPFAFSGEENMQSEELARAVRVGKVRALWEELVEEAILLHTNGVYVVKENDSIVMHVYVDEGIYAAELTNRRELIKVLCNQRHGQPLDDLQVHVSYGSMKKRYPYREEPFATTERHEPVPLNEEEKKLVSSACESIESPALRAKVEEAMIADLEWKKALSR